MPGFDPNLLTRLAGLSDYAKVPVWADPTRAYLGPINRNGFYAGKENGIVLAPSIAKRLTTSIQSGFPSKTAYALFVLSHEMGHHYDTLPFDKNAEHRANVYSANNFRRIARELGAGPARVRQLWQLNPWRTF